MRLKFNQYTVLLILIIMAGLFFRLYKSIIYLPYGHDNDLAGWVIRDIVFNKHFRLVGQETSTQGIYIGAFYYYLLIPFYLITSMEPTGGIILSAILGAFTVGSVYFVFKELFKKREIGLIGAGICAVSYSLVMNDRGNVPTTPVILWSTWFLYAIGLLLSKNNKKSFILLGVLTALTWHMNVTLVLLTILIPAVLIITRWKFDFKKVLLGFTAFFISSIPFFAFEIRHNFLQSRAVISSFMRNQGSELTMIEQFKRVLHIFSQIVTNLFWFAPQKLNFILPVILFGALIFLVAKKRISRSFAAITVLWAVLPVFFFTFYSKQVSEYYLNGVLVVALVIISLFLFYLISLRKYRIIGVGLMVIFAFLNIQKFFNYQDSRQGYFWRKALVKDIKKDANEHGYPCISVSYITNPGYELGYRYIFWLEDMHVNRPESGSPVYTIVFPQKPIFPENKSFGSLGLIYPDYKRYTRQGVEKSCSGQNSNLTDPLFGFTE